MIIRVTRKVCRGIRVIGKEIIKKIGDKPMDRKDFLKFGGLALVAVAGLKPIVNFLTQNDTKKVTIIETHKEVTRGFGGGKYGV